MLRRLTESRDTFFPALNIIIEMNMKYSVVTITTKGITYQLKKKMHLTIYF